MLSVLVGSLVYSLAETYEGNLQFDKAISVYQEALNSIVNPDGTVSSDEQDRNAARIIMQRIGLAYRLEGNRDKAMEKLSASLANKKAVVAAA